MLHNSKFFHLSVDCPLIEIWSLLPLSTTVGGEVETPVGRNWPLFFLKTSALSLVRVVIR